MGAAQSGQLDARESAAVAGEHVLEAMGAVSCRRGRTKVQVRQVRVGPRLAGKARSVGEGRSVPAARTASRKMPEQVVQTQCSESDGARGSIQAWAVQAV